MFSRAPTRPQPGRPVRAVLKATQRLRASAMGEGVCVKSWRPWRPYPFPLEVAGVFEGRQRGDLGGLGDLTPKGMNNGHRTSGPLPAGALPRLARDRGDARRGG